MSTYTPFFRRFTNERARELEEVRRLYQAVKAQEDACPHTSGSVNRSVARWFDDSPLSEPIRQSVTRILAGEMYLDALPPLHLEHMDLKEFVEFRNLLHMKQYFYANQAALVDLLTDCLADIFSGLTRELPEVEEPTAFTVPLMHALPEAAYLVEAVWGTVSDFGKYYDRGILRPLAERLRTNLFHASGRELGDSHSRKPLIQASDSKLPIEQIVDTYLAGTPLQDFFKTPVPLKLSREDRFSHTHIIGGTNAGKTTLIENLVLHDLTAEDPPSLVIVDPTGDLIQKLLRVDADFEDRLIYINPRDVHNPPAFNVFAMNRERLDTYDQATREQVTAGVIDTFDYLFTGLLGADLTAKQGVFFKYVAQLMLSLPEVLGRNATILDMMNLMSDPVPYGEAIGRLPDIPRDFFVRDFMGKSFVQTKEQIRYRLQAILANPTIARLFTTPETKIDLFEELNRGSIILVDTAKDFLKAGSSIYGRLFISLVLQAVLERAAIPAARRKDTFLIVDEAASYFDSNIDELLTEVRKYRCGCVFSHQYLEQASGPLRASLASNTSIKFASGLSARDARAMAPEMRTSAHFILSQPQHHFACYIKNVTPNAVSIPIPYVRWTPYRSADDYDRLIERNRARVAIPALAVRAAQARPQEPKSPAPDGPDEDISSDW